MPIQYRPTSGCLLCPSTESDAGFVALFPAKMYNHPTASYHSLVSPHSVTHQTHGSWPPRHLYRICSFCLIDSRKAALVIFSCVGVKSRHIDFPLSMKHVPSQSEGWCRCDSLHQHRSCTLGDLGIPPPPLHRHQKKRKRW